MRARSVSCTVKYMVSSSRWPATAAIALMQSASSSRSESSSPTPLSKALRSQWLRGSASRVPWRASAMRELPESVWQARYTSSLSTCGAGYGCSRASQVRTVSTWLEVSRA